MWCVMHTVLPRTKGEMTKYTTFNTRKIMRKGIDEQRKRSIMVERGSRLIYRILVDRKTE